MADDERPASAPWGRPGARDLTPPPPPAPTPPPPTQTAPAWGGHLTPPPPPAPPPGGRGVPPLLVAALVAVAVLAVVAVGAGAYLVTSGGDDEPEAGPTTTATVPPTSDPSSSSTTSEAAPPTSGTTTPPLGTPSLPSTPGGADVAPPPELPRPEGATTDVTGGLAVPGTAEAAVAFYLEALPAAGFTATRADLAGFTTVQVAGRGLDGQLLLVDIGLGTTTVLWQPNP